MEEAGSVSSKHKHRRLLHFFAKPWLWVCDCFVYVASLILETHTRLCTSTHTLSVMFVSKVTGPCQGPQSHMRTPKQSQWFPAELRFRHTCFQVLVETAVLGFLKWGQALLNGDPNIRLRTQQIRRSVLTLKRSEEKRHKHHKHSDFLVARLQNSREGINHKFKWSQPGTALL